MMLTNLKTCKHCFFLQHANFQCTPFPLLSVVSYMIWWMRAVGYGGVTNRKQLKMHFMLLTKNSSSNNVNLTAMSCRDDILEPGVLWKLTCWGR